jgi:molybdenum transport protein
MYLAQLDFDALIREDVPYFDLTGFSLGLDQQQAAIACFTREDCTVCGTEEAAEIFRRLQIETTHMEPSGTAVQAGAVLIAGAGAACKVLTAWKVVQNLLDHASGIATKTRHLVDAAHQVRPGLAVLTTRKMFPGTRALAIKGIMAGGAMPHRLGLSETVLVFPQHIKLLGGMEAFLQKLPALKASLCEKKILVETSDGDTALALCRAGADGIQFEKLSPAALEAACQQVKAEFPQAVLLAAGGIQPENVAEYAKAPISGIVTTSLYTAKPIDLGVRITPAEGTAQ